MSEARSAFSEDGRRLASACRDGTARVWDATPYEPPADTAPATGPRRP